MAHIKSPLATPRLPRLSTWIWAAFLLAAVDRPQIAEGQTSLAVCTNVSWTWSYNSKQQSPCLVAAYLLAPCGGGQYTVAQLPPQQHYVNDKPNNCFCSTVVYSLLSACAGCQTNSPAPRWSSWQANCTSTMISIKKYPNDINALIPVPAWAYLDVVTPDGLDLVSAMQVKLPESTVGNNVASTSSSATSSATLTSSSSNQSVNTPVIIGGTVGGVLGLGLIIALIIYLVKQDDTKKRQAPSAAFARAAATPEIAAAAGFRSASRQANPMGGQQQPFTSGTSVGHGGSNHGHGHGHGQRGTSPVFQLGYATPWSPPPPSSTPSGAVSPMSAQSLLMAQNYGSGGRLASSSFEYPNSSSVGHGTVDLLGHSGSMSSMRSTLPMMQQYTHPPTPPVGTTVPGPYANTRPTHPYAGYGNGHGHGRSGGHRSQFSGLPEI